LVYNALFNYYSIPIGAGKDMRVAFNFLNFIKRYKLHALITFNVLKVLEQHRFILFFENEIPVSKVYIGVTTEYLRNFIVQYPQYYELIIYLWQTTPAIMTDLTYIDEGKIAKALHQTQEQIIKDLQYLVRYEILTYEPKINGQQIIFLQERLPKTHLATSQAYQQLRELGLQKAEEMIQLLERHQCRQQQILAYFGEKVADCGKCDVCLASPMAEKELRLQILDLVKQQPQSLSFFNNNSKLGANQNIISLLRKMIDEGSLELKNGVIYLKY
jgi:ATP-dependent DNA helicase RecQ